MALFAGAFDERVALTIAQESGGGGGAAAWRVSETLGNVETLGNTSNAWFIEDMFRFANKVPKLPYDHHELMAMVAPRALLVLGNPDYEWLADESGYVSCRAAHEVWKAFGIPDRFGFSIVGGHGHCRLPESQSPEVEAFVDKFLLGNIAADTSVTKHPFEDINDKPWYDGWLTGKSTFPEPDKTNIESVFVEIENAKHGSDWSVVEDSKASNGQYLTIKSGLNSPNAAPTGNEGTMQIPFKVTERQTKRLRWRASWQIQMSSCPTLDQPGKVHGKASLGAKLNKRRQSRTHNDKVHAKIRPRGSSPGLARPSWPWLPYWDGGSSTYLPANLAGRWAGSTWAFSRQVSLPTWRA